MDDCSELREKLVKYIEKLNSKDKSDCASQNVFQMFIDRAKCLSEAPEIISGHTMWLNNKGSVTLYLKTDKSTCTYVNFHLSFDPNETKMKIKSRNELKHIDHDNNDGCIISDIDEKMVEKIYRDIMFDLD